MGYSPVKFAIGFCIHASHSLWKDRSGIPPSLTWEPLASYPVPRPAFRCLQYGTASDENLGMGLGTRLGENGFARHGCSCTLFSMQFHTYLEKLYLNWRQKMFA